MERTWKPTTAGILTIIAGSLGLLTSIGLIVGFSIIGIIIEMFTKLPGIGLFSLIAIPRIILSIVAIIGGIYALRRKSWGLALAGAICALLFTLPLLGWILAILAIIFVSLGKDEFESSPKL